MNSPTSAQPRVLQTAYQWWAYAAAYEGRVRATRRLVGVLWEYLRDSTPARLRQRFGDADYDWDHRVNTTSGAVGWRDRLLGQFHSEYQPTEPTLFHEMLCALQRESRLDFDDFTFLDLGSGKGRTLLMASDYPFRRIVGVELLAALDRIAQENLRLYKSDSQKCFTLESVCADATDFPLPEGPLLIYLFNPFPESGMRRLVANIEQNLRISPRAMYVLYHNPLLEYALSESSVLRKVGGTHQYSVFRGQ
jgi:SAM-dependent methyltransferase